MNNCRVVSDFSIMAALKTREVIYVRPLASTLRVKPDTFAMTLFTVVASVHVMTTFQMGQQIILDYAFARSKNNNLQSSGFAILHVEPLENGKYHKCHQRGVNHSKIINLKKESGSPLGHQVMNHFFLLRGSPKRLLLSS